MASNPKQSILVAVLSALIFLSPTPSHSADPDPLQDFCIANKNASPSINGFPCKPDSKVSSKDFFYSGLVHRGDTNNTFKSNVNAANVLSFPGLNTLGISMNRVDLDVEGINPPHVHPRATETGVVIEGKVLVGLISSRNKYYAKTISKGEMFVVPRGLIHFQMNVGKTKAMIITAFNSQLPGAVIVSTNLFGSDPPVEDEVLEKAFQVNRSVVDTIKNKFAVKK